MITLIQRLHKAEADLKPSSAGGPAALCVLELNSPIAEEARKAIWDAIDALEWQLMLDIQRAMEDDAVVKKRSPPKAETISLEIDRVFREHGLD